jgi:hypothetical protein
MALAIEFHPPGSTVAGALTNEAWLADDFDFWAFDRRVDALHTRGQPLHVIAAPDAVASLRMQLAIRTQRLAMQRNEHSSSSWFARMLVEHRALYDLQKPLVRADFDHALDTWQWTLRLDPDAPAAVQLAALLHDIERLVTEADVRIEHVASDYQAFKDAHARVGAVLAAELLDRAGVPLSIATRTRELIRSHERAGSAGELANLNDADALSFFSLNSPGYLAYFGRAQTAKKVAYTVGRMSPFARRWLADLRMPVSIRDEVQRCAS